MKELEALSKEELIRLVKIKDGWCNFIVQIGFDYDGFSTPESLKGLIDELVSYARKAISNDDTTCIEIGGFDNKEYNILHEEI